jgi:hypothetical protein
LPPKRQRRLLQSEGRKAMKKKWPGIFLTLLFLGSTGVELPWAAEKGAEAAKQASPTKVQVWWEFRTEPEKQDGDTLVPPYTEIFLVIGSKPEERLRIGRYMGNPYIHEELEGPHLPKEARNAVLSCWTWYAGAGDEFFVFQKGRSLVVKWRPLDEGMKRPAKIKAILTKKLDKNVAVEARE